jgi:ribosomal protein S18 acetylase RimI-like enzyme
VIEYRDTADGLRADQLGDFFEGWPVAPSNEQRLEILRRSSAVVVAVDTTSDRVVGFVTAISDGVLSAYIPLLEVRREDRGRGIGTRLVERLLERLDHLYMIDLVCDPPLEPFYARLGMRSYHAMMIRNRSAIPV